MEPRLECRACGMFPIPFGWRVIPIIDGEAQSEIADFCQFCYETRTNAAAAVTAKARMGGPSGLPS